MSGTRLDGDQPGALRLPEALALRVTGVGVLLSVRVVPRARRTALDGIVDGALRVRVTAPPVSGAANVAVVAFLATCLRVSKSAVSVAAGANGRHKTVLVVGLDQDEVRSRLDLALEANDARRK